jgi:hypothetical protein
VDEASYGRRIWVSEDGLFQFGCCFFTISTFLMGNVGVHGAVHQL